MLKRIARASIWAPNGVSAKDWRFRGIFRFVLPVTDLLFLWFGIVGCLNGVRSLQEAVGAEWQAGWSVLVAISAFVALVGVSFPKLWVIEMVGKCVLIGLVSAYVLVAVGNILEPHASATAGLVVILILLPIWRVGDLGFVAWQRGHLARFPR
jgi:hypothetical protein